MNRRKILGMIGAAPVAAAAAPDMLRAAAEQKAAAEAVHFQSLGAVNWAGGTAPFPEPQAFDPSAIVKAAYRTGVISREQLAAALDYGSLPMGEVVDTTDLASYKSFSGAAKRRIAAQRAREKRICDFLEPPAGGVGGVYELAMRLMRPGQ